MEVQKYNLKVDNIGYAYDVQSGVRTALVYASAGDARQFGADKIPEVRVIFATDEKIAKELDRTKTLTISLGDGVPEFVSEEEQSRREAAEAERLKRVAAGEVQSIAAMTGDQTATTTVGDTKPAEDVVVGSAPKEEVPEGAVVVGKKK